MEAGSRLSSFIQWMSEQGMHWNKEVITFEAPPGLSTAGTGVWARDQNVPADTVLCTLPKSALLSIRTSRIADLLEEEHINGGLGLTIAVAYERASGAASPWCKYLDFLPKREFLPLFWDDALLELCAGTEIDVARVHADSSALREDYADVEHLLERHPDRFTDAKISFECFVRAASWVSSRAFHVDDEHGMSMVPLADVFNHKASVISLTDTRGYVVAEYMAHHADSDGDSEDGSDDGDDACEADAARGEARLHDDEHHDTKRRRVHTNGAAHTNGQEGAAETTNSGCKVIEQGQEGVVRSAGAGCDDGDSEARSKAEDEKLEEEEEEEEEEEVMPEDEQAYLASFPSDCKFKLEIIIREQHDDADGDDSDSEAEAETLQILAAQALAPRAEVHNTYGEHGNAELLYKYGFALAAANPFDAVTLQLDDLRAAAQERCTTSAASVLDDALAIVPGLPVGPSSSEDGTEPGEPLEVFHNGFIGGALAVLLLAIHMRLARAELALQDVLARLQVVLGVVDVEANAQALGDVGKVPLFKMADEVNGPVLDMLSDLLNARLARLQSCIGKLDACSVTALRAACSSKPCSEAECSTAVTGIHLCAVAERSICEEALAELR